MRPELIGSFPAAGEGGRRVTVRVALSYHKDPRSIGRVAEEWVPDPNVTLTTEDGSRVYRLAEEPERYLVVGTSELLTPVGPTAALFELYDARRIAVVAQRGRTPR